MATQKRIKAVIQFRRGLEEEWQAVNPLLQLGEPAYSKDVQRLKIGDGVHRWRELGYIDANIHVDDELSPVSVNPVQNKVLTAAIQELADEIAEIGARVLYGTTDYWNNQPELIAQEYVTYVYTDGFSREAHNIVRSKIGDGRSYLIDLPYTDIVYYDHINDPIVHVTQEEREFWNNKVSCRIEGETINFTTSRV